MRLTVPIAIAATYVAFSTNALPTVDRQQPFLSHTQLDAPLHLNSTLNQQYSGHQVLILTASNQQELSALDALRQQLALDFWTPMSLDKPIQVRITPDQRPQFFDQLPSSTNYSIAIPDLQTFLDQPLQTSIASTRTFEGFETFFTKYHSYDEINAFLDGMAEKHKKLVKKVQIGTTSEGKPIYAWRIHKENKKQKNKTSKTHMSSWLEDLSDNVTEWFESARDLFNSSVDKDDDDDDDEQSFMKKKKHKQKHRTPMEIIINGGQHGREWISPAVVTYIMSAFLENYEGDKNAHRLLKYFTWTFIPVLNVDGYEYSHNTDRMWRKNRQSFVDSKCIGVDLNRNWDFEWERRGYDSNPCSESYVGSSPFSAPESRALSEYIISRKRVISYLDLHSFSQMWMTPCGNDSRHEPPDNEDIVEAALHAVKSLKRVHDKQFEIAPTSGDAIEWSYTRQHVKYSYEIELRDTGSYGFLLPPAEILPSGEEIFSAVQNLALFIRSRDGKGKKGT
ncbi:Carboxypeptidase A5 [Umbelopsis nana]